MKKPWIIVIALVAIVLLWGVSTYNKLVKQQEAVTTAWGQVENVYQRRADLIPNIVTVVKQYTEYEQETLVAVTEARAKAAATNINIDEATDLASFEAAQDELSQSLNRMLITVEDYPELKANEEYLGLQAQLTGCENRIVIERERFNETAKAYNQTVRRFPSNLIANMFGFEKRAYFVADEGANTAPKAF